MIQKIDYSYFVCLCWLISMLLFTIFYRCVSTKHAQIMFTLVVAMTTDPTSLADRRRSNASTTSSASAASSGRHRRVGLCNIFSGVGNDEIVDLQHVGRRLKRHRISSLSSGSRRSSDCSFLTSSSSFDTSDIAGKLLFISSSFLCYYLITNLQLRN